MNDVQIETKHFFIIFAIVITIFAGFYYYFFIANSVEEEIEELQPEPWDPQEVFQPAKMSLLLTKDTFDVDETFSVEVLVNTTNRKTVGVDVVLTYDPSLLEIVGGEKKFVDYSGSVFDMSPGQRFDSETGEITFSAIVSPEKDPFQGQGLIGTLQFKALEVGETSLSFVHKINETGDSNISYKGKDILGEVEDAAIKIQ